ILKMMVKKRIDSGERQDDLLDMLLEAKYEDGGSMEEEQLIDEILILFTAGHETTSNALSFTIQLLALHPEWQERLYKELQNLDESSLMSKIKGLSQTQWVIEESMRMFPPVYFIDRLSQKSFDFGGYHFNEGENILFSIYEIHHSNEFWDSPNDFNPERFSEGGNQYSSHYFPFGAGPRKCIGNNFAMFEMILAVSELVKRYKIYPKFREIEIKPLISMKPRNANVLLELR
ncbi:MAG: cytochrome P450, partial [Flavobacteriaceae bacterium]|nr:cytochrome P450 [Flavobacteriaceae bacterium]